MSAPPSELRSLLVRTRRGDEHSARRLFASVSPVMIACARRILSDEALACDATQAVFLKVLSMPTRELKKIDAPLPWLVTLARNEARDTLRARTRAASREQRPTPTPAPYVEPADEIRDAIGALPDELAEVVILKHVGGMTFDEIGAALDLNRNTAASRYARAKQALRDLLGSRGATAPLEAPNAR